MTIDIEVRHQAVALQALSFAVREAFSPTGLGHLLVNARRSVGTQNLNKLEHALPLLTPFLAAGTDTHYMPSAADEAWSRLSKEQQKDVKEQYVRELENARRLHPELFVK